MEDNLGLKTTFDGRQPLVEDDNEDNLNNKEGLLEGTRHWTYSALRYFLTRTCTYICRSCEANRPTELTEEKYVLVRAEIIFSLNYPK